MAQTPTLDQKSKFLQVNPKETEAILQNNANKTPKKPLALSKVVFTPMDPIQGKYSKKAFSKSKNTSPIKL